MDYRGLYRQCLNVAMPHPCIANTSASFIDGETEVIVSDVLTAIHCQNKDRIQISSFLGPWLIRRDYCTHPGLACGIRSLPGISIPSHIYNVKELLRALVCSALEVKFMSFEEKGVQTEYLCRGCSLFEATACHRDGLSACSDQTEHRNVEEGRTDQGLHGPSDQQRLHSVCAGAATTTPIHESE